MKKKHLKKVLSFTTAFFLAFTSIQFAFVSEGNAAEVKASSVRTIDSFDLNEVTMNDSYCKNSFSKEVSYLLSFDTNRLLAGFRENAGLNTYGAKRYDGWEGCLIAGHTLGHYLTALAQAYNNPNISSSDKTKVYNNIKILIDGLLQCQRNSKGKPGLIWGAPKVGSGVETQFDNLEHNKTNIINESWVPWYTIHKIMTGLVDVYNLTNYENAKVVASGLGDWTYNRANGWNSATHRQVLNVEYGGMNDCLYELYKITGKETHLDAAHKFDDEDLFKRISQGAKNSLNNMHANTTIPKFIGALKRYTTLNGSGDSANYLKYAEVFWDTVVNRHTYVTGGNSEWEHFGLDNILDKERTNCNCETCNVYNMLKLSRELFMITGDAKYMNYYENAYYNSILSSQNPETGMTTYFQPMASGYFKTFSTPFNNFWCCTGTGIENFTKLGDTNYMHKGNTLYVNIYQSSSISWKDQGVTIVQDTNIPESDTAKFTINTDKQASLNLKFRIPDWCLGTMSIQKNGEDVKYTTEKGYADVSDTFANGDVITVKIPLGAVAYSLPDNKNSIAFKYGPLVLSAELGTSNMTLSSTGMNVTIPKNKVISSEVVNLDPSYGSVDSYMKDINKYLVKSENGLQFKLTGTDQNLTFSPHYKQYKQRYAIYLNYSTGSTSVDPKDQASVDIIDTVQPGYGQYESDDLHAMLDNNSIGITNDGTYRYAKANGSFAYRMAVDKNAKFKYLGVTFRKADNGKSIKIKVGKYVVYAKTLNYTGTSDSYKENIMIPDDVIANSLSSVTIDDKKYNTVTVTFSSNDSKDSARVCDFIYMTAVKPNYKVDSSLAYYVNCGDHDTTTPSGSDGLGIFNSVTEQLYKTDSITGYKWGIVDDGTDKYDGSSRSAAIYTANTWPDEYNTDDDSDKSTSYRYTKNQYENKIDRHLDYNFELPNGTYDVEIGLANPWKCSESPTIYSNYGEANQSVIAKNISVGNGTTVKGSVKVTDGKLTINAKSNDKAINLTYILIKIGKMDALKIEPDTVEIGSGTNTNPDKPNPVIADGWYYIKNVNADKYLTVTDNQAKAGANVEISSGANADGQKWKVTNQSDGYITLTSALGNFMLDVANGSSENSTNIGIYTAHSGDAQRFKLQSTTTENAYTLATKASDVLKVLDVSERGKNDGSNVIQYTLNGGTNQQFIFEPIKETPSVEPEGLKATYTINNWGLGYNVSFKVTNNGSKIDTWTLKVSKSDINIESSWNVNVKESGSYYFITPLSWNSTIDKGGSVEFGINGKGSIGSTISCSVE